MSALRDTEGKLEWSMLFEHFPLAMQELCKARMYGARHYTKDGKDGVTNWKDSINGPEHEKFFKGCIRGAISHNFKRLWGQERDKPQDNVHHLAFSALNDLMALEYDLNKKGGVSYSDSAGALKVETIAGSGEYVRWSEDPNNIVAQKACAELSQALSRCEKMAAWIEEAKDMILSNSLHQTDFYREGTQFKRLIDEAPI